MATTNGNTVLVDIWIESGVFAEENTDAMMDEKTYYQAVQGYILMYKALCQIHWLLLSSFPLFSIPQGLCLIWRNPMTRYQHVKRLNHLEGIRCGNSEKF